MTTSKRVTKAFKAILDGDAEDALFEICAAIEQTAKREGIAIGKKGAGYKQWVKSNIPIIMSVGVGAALSGLSVKYAHPKLVAKADGTQDIEDILYHAIRCGLYHEAALPPDLAITEKTLGPDANGVTQIPQSIVAGLIVAVVASPANASLTTDDDYFFTFGQKRFYLNEWAGQRDDLLKEMKKAKTSKARRDFLGG